MAFDYGSIDLGIRNPFKREGLVTAVRGGIEICLGIILLIKAASNVKEDAVLGWILVLFGFLLLVNGLRATSGGILAMLRYFVGRNHPTSLAQNFSRSEASTAQEEISSVAYSKQALTEMLVGRKNTTFVEPDGFLARLVHSIFPNLTYMPYPVRNMAQRFFGAWVKTSIALVAYALVAFVSISGFAGETGEIAFPIYSVVLTLYLVIVWRSIGTALNRTADKSIPGMGRGELARIIGGAIIAPIIIGISLGYIFKSSNISLENIENVLAYLPKPHTLLYIIGILAAAAVTTVAVSIMLKARLQYSNPKAEVSELRENWQESVHPNEIFINLDNLVMANRRYKEVPNRIYQELEPNLNEQIEGKGNFFGEMIQEIQPKVKAMELGSSFGFTRLISLISGNVLFLLASIFIIFLATQIGDGYAYHQSIGAESLSRINNPAEIEEISDYLGSITHLFLLIVIIRAFARILTNIAHLFYAEMQFESMLIYAKVEGTFTESKISTGTAIHDSTRSENTLVRSSITPWIIVTRIITSTFAASGMRNLEHPRFILEMHKNDEDLMSIRNDIIGFLKDRESIASITSERDLSNASQIYEINEQSRAVPNYQQEALPKLDDEAAGYLENESESTASEEGEK